MPKGKQFAWPMIVRTAVMDEMIMDAVGRRGVDTVLNLAAGLDARPYRLKLPTSIKWIDADLPDILGYKEEQLADERPACALEFAKVDLTDATQRRALFERVGAEVRQALVITEGLLVYLTPKQVTELADDLHAQSTFRWWLIDIVSPRLLKMLQKTWGDELRSGGAPLIFAPAESTAYFEPSGWFEAEFRSTGEEARRLKRLPLFIRFWNLTGRLYPKKTREHMQRMAGIAMLRSDAAPAGISYSFLNATSGSTVVARRAGR